MKHRFQTVKLPPVMTHPNYAIEVQGITKRFGSFQALKGVSFNVPRETVYGILGPNGAGKTTLLRILTTVSRPDSGLALIEGKNIATHKLAIRSWIGIVAQENRFDQYLSIWHNLSLHAKMHGFSKRTYESRLQELLEMVGMYDRRNNLPDELSGGMQRRVALVRALLHRPRLLFLDEPSTGLDPEARLEIWQTIEQIKREATVILTTHYMEEADRLSDTLLLLSQGQVVGEGSPQSLKQAISPVNRYEILLRTPTAQVYRERLGAVLGAPSAESERIRLLNDSHLEIQLDGTDRLTGVLQAIAPQDLLRVGLVESDLEDVFMSIAGSRPVVSGNLD